MSTLKQIKQDMRFNQELNGLIDVLKGIASSHFRHLQAKREYSSRFKNSLVDFFGKVDLIKSRHPFLVLNPALPSAIVMITSDEGFLGALNSQVISAGLEERKPGDVLIVVGERGAHSLEEFKEPFLYFPGISEDIEYKQIESIRDYLVQQYLRRKFGRVVVVYPKFISFSMHEIKVEQVLPHVRDSVLGSRFSDEHPEPSTEHRALQSGILVEPNDNRIIDYLIRIWLVQKVYDIFWESKLSELSSRIIHLEGSSQVISNLSKQLQLVYFRAVHQISDKNIREIIASRLVK